MSYFFQSLESFSERTAIILKDRGRISYRELASKADDFLTQLPKEPVLIFIEMANELEAIVAYLGALRGNHPAILACPQRAELTEQIKSIYQPDAIYEKIEGKWKLTVNTLKGDLHSDLGILLSTSGSTGSPKCIKLSQKNLNSNAKSIVEYLHIDDKQRAIANLPLYYSYGLSVLNSHLEAGASLVLTDESVADDSFWDLFKKEEVTSLAGVPYVYEMLDRRGFYDMHLPSLQYLTQAGGRLAPELARKFALDSLDKKRLFYVMYGQTEATARIAYMPPCKLIENTKCMGVPIPGGQIKLYDGQREITETDTAGELVYSGPNVMMGYAESRSDLIKPAEVKELRTGDIACKNNEGLYYIVGRQSRFLKLFGLRINLDEVETFLRRQGYEAICGGTDQQLVVLSTNIGQAAKIKEMIISQYKLSPTVVTAIEEDKIPLLPSGKINYKKLIDFAKNPNKINENFEKLGFLKKIRNFIINTEEKAEKCIAESFKDILGLNHIPQEENFKSLSGDSLSYVNLSIELEEKLGYLPDNWEDKSIAELKELSLQKRTINKTDNHWKSINFFRALAILFIVASHCIYPSMWGINTFPEKVFFSLVKDGTILFTFISGFIFYQFSRDEFHYFSFIKGKIKSLLIPYIFLSILMIYIRYYLSEPLQYHSAGLLDIWPNLITLLTGTALTPYWYIPFVIIMFIMSPIHLKIMNLSTFKQISIISVMFIGGLLVHRPTGNTYAIHSLIQNLVYFTPVYLIGILSSKHKEYIYTKLTGKDIYLGILVIVIATLQVLIYDRIVNNTPFLEYKGIDLQLIQKTLMCYLFMIFLHRFRNIQSPLLDLLATTSFAIYLLHFFFVYFVERHISRYPEDILLIPPLMWCFYLIAYTSASILVAVFIKKVFKSKSKYLTGY